MYTICIWYIMIVLKLFGASEANWSWDLSPWALVLGLCSLHKDLIGPYRTRKILLVSTKKLMAVLGQMRSDPAPGMNIKILTCRINAGTIPFQSLKWRSLRSWSPSTQLFGAKTQLLTLWAPQLEPPANLAMVRAFGQQERCSKEVIVSRCYELLIVAGGKDHQLMFRFQSFMVLYQLRDAQGLSPSRDSRGWETNHTNYRTMESVVLTPTFMMQSTMPWYLPNHPQKNMGNTEVDENA